LDFENFIKKTKINIENLKKIQNCINNNCYENIEDMFSQNDYNDFIFYELSCLKNIIIKLSKIKKIKLKFIHFFLTLILMPFLVPFLVKFLVEKISMSFDFVFPFVIIVPFLIPIFISVFINSYNLDKFDKEKKYLINIITIIKYKINKNIDLFIKHNKNEIINPLVLDLEKLKYQLNDKIIEFIEEFNQNNELFDINRVFIVCPTCRKISCFYKYEVKSNDIFECEICFSSFYYYEGAKNFREDSFFDIVIGNKTIADEKDNC